MTKARATTAIHSLHRALSTRSPGGGTASAEETAVGVEVVGAEDVGAPCESTCSFSARANSEHRLNRASGRLVRPIASTGSSLARSGRLSASLGGATLRWWLMTTAGLELGTVGNRLEGGTQWLLKSTDQHDHRCLHPGAVRGQAYATVPTVKLVLVSPLISLTLRAIPKSVRRTRCSPSSR